MRLIILTFVPTFLLVLATAKTKYTPDWDSLDSRPNPQWYDRAKFGIFMHWGVYSVIGRGEWLWQHWKIAKDNKTIAYMEKHYPNGTTYAEFARQFTAEEFEPDQFAEIVKASGAKYFVLTSKHHEGYTLYPSRTTFSWNSVDIGPRRDLVADLAKSIRAKNIHFGLYFSQYEWFNPLYMQDNVAKTTLFPEQVTLPQLHEIVENYEPDVIWSDGDWDNEAEYWQSQKFLAWLFNESPIKDKVVVNDRWGRGVMGKHGSFLTFADDYVPGHLIERKWECCTTLDTRSWGYRRDMTSGEVISSKEAIQLLVSTVAWGGNLLLNVAPNRLGRIPAIFEERLREIGKFMGAYEEAIVDTKPWIYQNDSESIWYTSKLRSGNLENFNRAYNPQLEQNTIIYAFVLDWDESNMVTLKSVKWTSKIKVTLLSTNIALKIWSRQPLNVVLPAWQKLPYRDAAVIKIENAGNSRFTPTVHSS